MTDPGNRSKDVVRLDGDSLTVEKVVRVAREFAKVELAPAARDRMAKSRKALEKLVEDGRTIYAINTGVGELVDVRIPPEELKNLQVNLIRSHACGVGERYPVEIARAMMLLRANALAKGYSGVRPDIVRMLVDMLNRRVHPMVPRQGSVGASGDLVMLAHLGLVMIGEGEADAGHGLEAGASALKRKKLSPVSLEPKEAISLINGTQAMGAVGVLTVKDAAVIADNAQIAASMSLEALKGTSSAFDLRISQVRPHKGQLHVSRNMLSLLQGSEIMVSHHDCPKVQDAYSLRCVPQVIGASIDAIWYAHDVLGVEMNSATDNPLFFPDDGMVISGGNFHGQPLALAMDFLGLAVHELGSFSERRTARMVDDKLSGLPAFLTRHGGVSSGLMVPQYVAASIVSENKILVHPASADSIPTSANQEDHNSMGATAAWKARIIAENVRRVIAIEMITAAQGIDFIHLSSSPAIEKVKGALRREVPPIEEDRSLTREIEKVADMISQGVFVQAAESACGFLRA
ncbi:MAG: histidine ammonia-lyase [Thermoplasmatota archaeon]|nr:histidine ammonia-lyase [Candidatus Thermoplasmatota archaeon]MBU1914485.1 histidine ammonia-lyase [Candidatus Thermoplasmatota archaeon]